MWILFVFAGFMSLIIAGSGYTNYIGREMPRNSQETVAYVTKYHTFSHVAAIYWRKNPNASGNFCWDTIKQAGGVPDTLKLASIGAYDGKTWRVIARGNDGYKLCAEMPDTARALAQVTVEAICSTETTCT